MISMSSPDHRTERADEYAAISSAAIALHQQSAVRECVSRHRTVVGGQLLTQ